MKPFAMLVLVLLFCGCDENRFYVERFVPTTDAERKASSELMAKILASTPSSLAGHDQDWDDAIDAAKKAAFEATCRPTYWERANNGSYYDYSGRWKYGIVEITNDNPPPVK